MILLDLRNYLVEHKRATLTDLCHRFELPYEAVSGMMEHWIVKGKVRKLSRGKFCSQCQECDPGIKEIYEWVV